MLQPTDAWIRPQFGVDPIFQLESEAKARRVIVFQMEPNCTFAIPLAGFGSGALSLAF